MDRGQGRGAPSADTPQCQICHKYNHTADRCYHRFDYNYAPPPPKNMQALYAQPIVTPSEAWFLDSGATNHITYDLNNLSSHSAYTGTDQVKIGDGRGLPLSHLGHTVLPSTSKPLHLANVLHVPLIKKSLISISQFTRDNENFTLIFFL